ncbi:hypothetical protein [Streptomyces sp. URMC 129]|uniref:hypothetical protein n=1 Tax=Streptomyces sp. URMC 129 TaxID=3423407 RepID=UPI003F1D80ED
MRHGTPAASGHLPRRPPHDDGGLISGIGGTVGKRTARTRGPSPPSRPWTPRGAAGAPLDADGGFPA